MDQTFTQEWKPFSTFFNVISATVEKVEILLYNYPKFLSPPMKVKTNLTKSNTTVLNLDFEHI